MEAKKYLTFFNFIIVIAIFFNNALAYDTNKKYIQIVANSKEILVNGESVRIADKIRFIDDKIMVPLCFLKEVGSIDYFRTVKDSKTAYIMVNQPILYTNGDELEDLIDLIENAEESIDIQMYRLQEPKIIYALRDARKRGLKMRVLLDRHTDNKTFTDGDNEFETEFELEGQENRKDIVHWKAPSIGAIMHRKLAIIDKSVFVLGSTNWTKPGLRTTKRWNWEITLIHEDKEILEQLLETFDFEWDSFTTKDY